MAKVWIPPPFRDLTGGVDTVDAAGGNVRQVIASLEQAYPGFHARLCGDDALKPGISVAIDSDIAPLGLFAPVKDDSEVHFLPALGGGM